MDEWKNFHQIFSAGKESKTGLKSMMTQGYACGYFSARNYKTAYLFISKTFVLPIHEL